MKKGKFFKYFLILLTILIVVAFWQPEVIKVVMKEGIILNRTDTYHASNENGKPIEAEFYLKKKNLHHERVNEIIVKFNKTDNWGDYYLLLMPDSSWIGRPNQSKKDFKVIFNKWLFQSESGENFKLINDSVNFFIHQVIKKWSFGNDTIRFNSFDELETLGKGIIISPKSSLIQ